MVCTEGEMYFWYFCNFIIIFTSLLATQVVGTSIEYTSKFSVKSNLFYFTSFSIQGIHKKMVRFQKLIRNLFLNLHGHNVHRQQRKLSKFLMRYQQFASHAYCGASGQFPRWRRSKKRLSVCSVLRCPDLWLQREEENIRNMNGNPVGYYLIVWFAATWIRRLKCHPRKSTISYRIYTELWTQDLI